MNYFTRELYARCQSRDEAVLEAASQEWEQANERYEQHLKAIEPDLPASVRELSSLLLHDAEVRSIARQNNRLLLVLHKDVPPPDLVFLNYELEGEPAVEPYTSAPRDWSRPTDFQFDELGLERDNGRTLFTQSIVFGNGWLLRLRFRDVQVSVAQPLFPTGALALLPAPALPQTT